LSTGTTLKRDLEFPLDETPINIQKRTPLNFAIETKSLHCAKYKNMIHNMTNSLMYQS